MKKYKLLKDLPTWKAGEIFILKEDGNLFWNDNGTEVMIYFSATIEKFGILENKEWFEEIPEEPKSVFDLKKGDDYWFISAKNFYSGSVFDYEKIEKYYLETWNVFATEKEAKQELEKMKAIARIKKYCWGNNIELFSHEEINETLKNNTNIYRSNTIDIYYIYYSAKDKWFNSGFWNVTKYTEYFYFKKEEDTKQVIENCESDLKIIFNV